MDHNPHAPSENRSSAKYRTAVIATRRPSLPCSFPRPFRPRDSARLAFQRPVPVDAPLRGKKGFRTGISRNDEGRPVPC
jgi:hypothetical protein